MEEQLIREGTPVEEVQRLCDLHVAVVRNSLEEQGPIGPASPPQDATNAHAFAGTTYDYYFGNFSRDSFDDNDGSGPLGQETCVSVGTVACDLLKQQSTGPKTASPWVQSLSSTTSAFGYRRRSCSKTTSL